MFTVRNLGGAALFLFGTTFVWLTPMFAASDVDTSGPAWSTAAVQAVTTMVGFTLATWGLFRRAVWWETVAGASAAVGLVALAPYWVAAQGAGVANPVLDVVIHATGSVGVLVLLRVPRLEHWVGGHVLAGH